MGFTVGAQWGAVAGGTVGAVGGAILGEEGTKALFSYFGKIETLSKLPIGQKIADLERVMRRGWSPFGSVGPFYGPRCFPAGTGILTAKGERQISDICIGDVVITYDPDVSKGRGGLVYKRVTRVFQNTTDEWIKLSWSEYGERRELISTLGHHFLDEFGSFSPIEDMIENGEATVIHCQW